MLEILREEIDRALALMEDKWDPVLDDTAACVGETKEKSLPRPPTARMRKRSDVGDAFEDEQFVWKQLAQTPYYSHLQLAARPPVAETGSALPQPPQLETPTVPSATPRSEDTAEDENDADWDPLQMLVDVAAEVVPEKHTSTVTGGPLRLLLSATDGQDGSTQVTQAEQVNTVSRTEGNWRRQCGFLGFESLKSSKHALQKLFGGQQCSQEDMDNTSTLRRSASMWRK
ncbi:hypothetical protein HPB47_019390 [Ixodes persulcatus]|uniref:Uncharacterized protein n=1 Tax=Ixodes persulcatus TaxID=34615 RepID=A0AC60QK64_IXOPE|nr:hypothetical protein HPB47_019390 [Ixodes persulcatus]